VAEEAAWNAPESARCSENKHDESKAKQKRRKCENTWVVLRMSKKAQ
jgi:hypothetical protein